MEFLVLIAAGVIVYLANKSQHREEIRQQEEAENIDEMEMPSHTHIIVPDSNNKYMQQLLRDRVPPTYVTYGPHGIPEYYFPLPGGKGFYKVNHFDNVE